MSVKKRYLSTGSTIIVILVLLVIMGRVVQKKTSVTQLEGIKTKGPQNAPVHLVVYSDFQCPACAKAREPIEALEKEFGQVLQIEYRHYPLERVHRWAILAALFAECAAEQGKFWQFHDRLFEDQRLWSGSTDAASPFSEYASELGLDLRALEHCLANPRTVERIKKDAASGKAQHVSSTPTIFLNDRMVVGAKQLGEQGKTIIMEELKKVGRK